MFQYMNWIRIPGALLLLLVGCGAGKPSPAEIEAAMEFDAARLAGLDAKR